MKPRHNHTLSILASFLLLSVSACAPGESESSKRDAKSSDDEFPEALILDMNERIMHMGEDHSTSDPTTQAVIEEEMAGLIEERARILNRFVPQYPTKVGKVALPPEARDRLPEKVRRCIEKDVWKQGRLKVFARLMDDETTRIDYSFEDEEGRQFALHAEAGLEPAADSGTRVTVEGLHIPCGMDSAKDDGIDHGISQGCPDAKDGVCAKDPIALPAGTSSVSTVETLAAAGKIGEQRTLVMVLSFSDKANTFAMADVNSNLTSTSNYWYEASYRQTWMNFQAVGPYTIPVASTSCDSYTIATQAKNQARAAGIVLEAFDRFVYVFPSNSACGWSGLGTVGGNPSESWMNGSIRMGLFAHELGHNIGLYHARALSCGATVMGNSTTACSLIEYGDTTDVMGRVTAHYNSFMKERLGWLGTAASPAITLVQSSGAYSVEPMASYAFSPKALKILRSTDAATGAKTYFYVEFRQPTGYDAIFNSVGTNNLTKGVVIHTGINTKANSSDLLNMNPATGSWYQAALNPGQTFTDSVSGVSIQLASYTSAGATVNVALANAPVPCVRANPTVTVTPAAGPSVRPGTSVSYTVSVKNNDSASCANSDFSLTSALPGTGWTGTFSSSTTGVLAPGATGTATLQIKSPTSAAASTYTSGVTARNSSATSYVASAAMTYRVVVNSALTVGVITNQSVYTRGQYLYITITSKNSNGTAAYGASYRMEMTRPDGTLNVRTGTIGSTGVVKLAFSTTYSLRGTYSVKASSSLNTASGSATTSFVIQ